MTKPWHGPLMTVISHFLSIDMLFIIDAIDIIVQVITTQYSKMRAAESSRMKQFTHRKHAVLKALVATV